MVACEAASVCPIVSVCVPGQRVPCLDVGRIHAAKLELCNALEAIADGLPARVDRRRCLIVAAALVPLLQQGHAYEERHIFPAFEQSRQNNNSCRLTVRRLKVEHVEDECAAQDLADVLFSIGHGAPIDNPEALGFMLRAFFEAVRRHVAFEREYFFPATVEWS